MDKGRKEFYQSIRRGKAVEEARRQGVEMVDAERLADMLTDLARGGFIKINDNRGDTLTAAQRGIEILRG